MVQIPHIWFISEGVVLVIPDIWFIGESFFGYMVYLLTQLYGFSWYMAKTAFHITGSQCTFQKKFKNRIFI